MRRWILLLVLAAITCGTVGCGEASKAPPPGAPDAVKPKESDKGGDETP